MSVQYPYTLWIDHGVDTSPGPRALIPTPSLNATSSNVVGVPAPSLSSHGVGSYTPAVPSARAGASSLAQGGAFEPHTSDVLRHGSDTAHAPARPESPLIHPGQGRSVESAEFTEATLAWVLVGICAVITTAALWGWLA